MFSHNNLILLFSVCLKYFGVNLNNYKSKLSNSRVNYNFGIQNSLFNLFKHYLKIKILTKSGFEWGLATVSAQSRKRFLLLSDIEHLFIQVNFSYIFSKDNTERTHDD